MAKLFLGNREVTPAIYNGSSSVIDTTSPSYQIAVLLQGLDSNNVLQTLPLEDIVFTNVENIADNVLNSALENNNRVRSVSFPDLLQLSNESSCSYTFKNCLSLTSVSLPNLTTISGNRACFGMFNGCTGLTSVSFPSLTTISGGYGCSGMFPGCSSLTDVSFPALTTISGNSGCSSMFSGCSSLTDVYFPALTTTSFGSFTNQFLYMMVNTSNTIIHTLHFPSNLESTIQGLDGYPLFSGTSRYVTLVFDLPATE